MSNRKPRPTKITLKKGSAPRTLKEDDSFSNISEISSPNGAAVERSIPKSKYIKPQGTIIEKGVRKTGTLSEAKSPFAGSPWWADAGSAKKD